MADSYMVTPALNVCTFQKDDVILKEGENTPKVYILKEGSVSISINDEEVCRVCDPDSVFGEVSALLSMESSATVTALETSQLWFIEDFCTYMADNPKYALTIAQELAKRLNNMNMNFLEVRTALQILEENKKKQIQESETMVMDEDIVSELKAEYKKYKAESSQVVGLLNKVDKLLHMRVW